MRLFTDQYMYINHLLDCGKPVLPMRTVAFGVKYVRRSKLFSHHNNMTLFLLPASTPEFAIPLLSPFSSSVPVFSIKWSSSFQVPASTPRVLVPSCSCPREAAASAAWTCCCCFSTVLAGSFSCPLKMRSGLKCQLDSVDIWQKQSCLPLCRQSGQCHNESVKRHRVSPWDSKSSCHSKLQYLGFGCQGRWGRGLISLWKVGEMPFLDFYGIQSTSTSMGPEVTT